MPRLAGSAARGGPPCPVDPEIHGHLYKWSGKDVDRAYWCGHSSHGGNGKFFSYKEANGEYKLQEGDVTLIYEQAARSVIAGTITLDKAVQDVARQTTRPTAQVRESLSIMIDSIKEKDQTMADSKAAAKKKTAKQPGERRRLEHVEGARFQKALDDAGLTAAQAKEATGEAGMGASSTYVYILLHEGASVNLFEKFQAALKEYLKTHKAELKAAAKVGGRARKAKTTDAEVETIDSTAVALEPEVEEAVAVEI